MSPTFFGMHLYRGFLQTCASRAIHTVSRGKMGDGGHWTSCTKKSLLMRVKPEIIVQDAQKSVPHPFLGDTRQNRQNRNIVLVNLW